MSALLTSIVGLLVQGIAEFAKGIGSGMNQMVQSLFVDVSGDAGSQTYTLTVFGGLCVIFAGVALCVGLTRFITNWVTSFGK